MSCGTKSSRPGKSDIKPNTLINLSGNSVQHLILWKTIGASFHGRFGHI